MIDQPLAKGSMHRLIGNSINGRIESARGPHGSGSVSMEICNKQIDNGHVGSKITPMNAGNQTFKT